MEESKKEQQKNIPIKNTNNISNPKKETKQSDKMDLFDTLFKNNDAKSTIDSAHANTDAFIARQDNNNQEIKLLRGIQQNTADILDLLKHSDLSNSKNKNGFDMSSVLKYLPLLATALAAFKGFTDPHKTKEIQLATKAVSPVAKTVKAGAETIKDGSHIVKLAETAPKVAKVAEVGLHGVSTVAKGISKIADNKHVNNLSRAASVGMGAARYMEGDNVGAGMEAASLATSEASKKVKNPKAKLALMATSLATDGALLVKDWWNKKPEDNSTDTHNEKENEKENQHNESDKNIESTIKKEDASNAGLYGGAAISAGLIAGGTKGLIGGSKASIAPAISNTGLFSKITSLIPKKEATETVAKTVAPTIVKSGAKGIGKLIPGVGLALGAYGAYSRAKDGDYVGAVGEAVSGITSLIPGLGTAASAVIQGGLMARDLYKTTEKTTDDMNKTIKLSSNTVDKSSKTISEKLSETGDSLKSFTTSMGDSIGGWIKDGASIFSSAFSILDSVRGSVLSTISNIAKSILPKGVYDTASNLISTSGDNTSSIKIDTGKGEYDLGKHGGTMTASIMAGESGGNYGAANVRQSNGTYKSTSMDNRNYSVGQVTSMQHNKQINAFGAYQMLSSTIEAGTQKLGISKDTKMTKDVQDKIYQDYIIKDKRKAIYDYITGKSSNLSKAVISASMEWAAIGVPTDMEGYKGVKLKKGDSYYKGTGGNKANISPEEFGSGLVKQRKAYADLIKEGKKPEDAYHQSFNAQERTIKSVGGAIVGALTPSDDPLYKTANIGKTNSSTSTQNSISPQTASQVEKVTGTSGLSKLKSPGPVGIMALKDSSKNDSQQNIQPKEITHSKDDVSKKKDSSNFDYDLDKVVSYAMSSANKKSQGKCAEYVRKALQHGQSKKLIQGGLGNAKDFMSSLPKVNFNNIGKNNSKASKGDIAVFPVSGSKYGHVCIFTGSCWVSDFVQNTVQPNSKNNYEFYLFRANSGISNGTAVGSPNGSSIEADDKSKTDSGLSGSSESTDNQKSVMDTAIDSAVSAVGDLAASFANSEFAKSAINFVDGAKVDKFKSTNVGGVNMAGFEKMTNMNQNAFDYHSGNGEGVDENKLFNPNLDRQKDTGFDALDKAGSTNIISRQYDYDPNALKNAPHMDGNLRQRDYDPNALKNAGKIDFDARQNDYSSGKSSNIKKSKKKWYEKIFDSKHYSEVKDIASLFGLDGIMDDASSIYNISKEKDGFKNWGIDKAKGILTDSGYGDELGEGYDLYDTYKSGDWLGYGLKKTNQIISNNLSKNKDNNQIDLDFTDPNDFDKLTNNNIPLSMNNYDSILGGYSDQINTEKSNISDVPKNISPIIGKNGKELNYDGTIKSKFDVEPEYRHPMTYMDYTPSDSLEKLINNVEANKMVPRQSNLKPNTEDKSKVDGYISSVNSKYGDFKNNAGKSSKQSEPTESPIMNIPSQQKQNGGTKDGMSADIITRNPDSIFRLVSMTMMGASIK